MLFSICNLLKVTKKYLISVGADKISLIIRVISKIKKGLATFDITLKDHFVSHF